MPQREIKCLPPSPCRLLRIFEKTGTRRSENRIPLTVLYIIAPNWHFFFKNAIRRFKRRLAQKKLFLFCPRDGNHQLDPSKQKFGRVSSRKSQKVAIFSGFTKHSITFFFSFWPEPLEINYSASKKKLGLGFSLFPGPAEINYGKSKKKVKIAQNCSKHYSFWVFSGKTWKSGVYFWTFFRLRRKLIIGIEKKSNYCDAFRIFTFFRAAGKLRKKKGYEMHCISNDPLNDSFNDFQIVKRFV